MKASFWLVQAKLWVFVMLICMMAACQSTMPRKGADNAPTSEAPTITPVATPIVIAPRREKLEQRLLAQAEDAFRRGRFTTPEHDNAYDKFHSVLLLNSESAQARAGIQAILLRYAELVRSALRQGRIRTAKNYLKHVELFYPANALLMDLKKEIRHVQQTVRVHDQGDLKKSDVPVHEEVVLPRRELDQRSDTVKQALAEIGQRLKQTDESVLIFARNDREGRWIYKQLKAAVQDYRVRGDIRIGRAPKVRILPPL